MFAVVWLVALIVIYTNSRLILAVGLTVDGSGLLDLCAPRLFVGRKQLRGDRACCSRVGLACTYIGLVSSIVLEALEAGALTSAANAATFSGFMHFIRIFGGQSE